MFFSRIHGKSDIRDMVDELKQLIADRGYDKIAKEREDRRKQLSDEVARGVEKASSYLKSPANKDENEGKRFFSEVFKDMKKKKSINLKEGTAEKPGVVRMVNQSQKDEFFRQHPGLFSNLISGAANLQSETRQAPDQPSLVVSQELPYHLEEAEPNWNNISHISFAAQPRQRQKPIELQTYAPSTQPANLRVNPYGGTYFPGQPMTQPVPMSHPISGYAPSSQQQYYPPAYPSYGYSASHNVGSPQPQTYPGLPQRSAATYPDDRTYSSNTQQNYHQQNQPAPSQRYSPLQQQPRF